MQLSSYEDGCAIHYLNSAFDDSPDKAGQERGKNVLKAQKKKLGIRIQDARRYHTKVLSNRVDLSQFIFDSRHEGSRLRNQL